MLRPTLFGNDPVGSSSNVAGHPELTKFLSEVAFLGSVNVWITNDVCSSLTSKTRLLPSKETQMREVADYVDTHCKRGSAPRPMVPPSDRLFRSPHRARNRSVP